MSIILSRCPRDVMQNGSASHYSVRLYMRAFESKTKTALERTSMTPKGGPTIDIDRSKCSAPERDYQKHGLSEKNESIIRKR